MKEETEKIGWKEKDALNRAKWRVRSARNCRRSRVNRPISAERASYKN